MLGPPGRVAGRWLQWGPGATSLSAPNHPGPFSSWQGSGKGPSGEQRSEAPPFATSTESPDEATVADQESEDDLSASRTSLERQAPHRGNTMVHVCWHRNTSVSMVDFSVAVEVPRPGPWGGGGGTRMTHPLSIWLSLSGECDRISWPSFVPRLLFSGYLHHPSFLSSRGVSQLWGRACRALAMCLRRRQRNGPVQAEGSSQCRGCHILEQHPTRT